MADLSTINGTAEDNIGVVNGAADDTLTSANGLTWVHFTPSPVTIAKTANTTTTSTLTTYTFSSQSFGAADSTRQVVVGITGIALTSGRSISSVTIGGVSATALVSNSSFISPNETFSAVYSAEVPTGTTGSVVVTWSGSMYNCAIGVYRVLYAQTATHDTGVSTASPMSDTLNIPADGGAIAAFAWSSTGAGLTVAGLTEQFDATADGGNERYAGASKVFASTQTGLTVSGTMAGSITRRTMSVATWAQATE